MAEKPDKLAEQLGKQFNTATAEEILTYFLTHYTGRIIQGSGMGAEDQVITRMISTIDITAKIITLDTGRLFQETYDLIQKTNEHFGITIEVYFPDYKKVERMVKEKGINLFYESLENRQLCCHIRKNEPLKRALEGMDVWICGLRKDQTVTRFYNKAVEWDKQHSLIRVNPLISWTEKQVWDYIRKHQIPYNVLHDNGYPSIGCLPCTRTVIPGEDPRSGRWWWEDKGPKECGLHYK